jgi:hypothetical protein
MKLSRYLVFIIAASIMLLVAGSIVAQENKTEESRPAVAEPEVQWLWGEVVSIDAQNNLLLVKYLDYETDSEKEVTIGVDAKTAYENIKSLTDIKPQDNVSIDYVIGQDGKSVAKNISLEKPEAENPQKPSVQESEQAQNATLPQAAVGPGAGQ